jgi:hypothetical protein
MRSCSIPIAAVAMLAGCAAPPPGPSLAPRASEAIDPRVAVESPVAVAAVSPALEARLAELVNQAQVGDAAFRNAAARAERLAGAAGAPQSESWITAQQALSAAQAARAPTTSAMADIDSIPAQALATTGGIPAGNLAAIEAAAAGVAALERSQSARIEALQARLGG